MGSVPGLDDAESSYIRMPATVVLGINHDFDACIELRADSLFLGCMTRSRYFEYLTYDSCNAIHEF